MKGLSMSREALDALLTIDKLAWQKETEAIGRYLDEFRTTVPERLRDELRKTAERLAQEAVLPNAVAVGARSQHSSHT
jgi:GTP-dependent phosphoenolpyruvate carboxykinase